MTRPIIIGFVANQLTDIYDAGLISGAAALAHQRGVQLLVFEGTPWDIYTSRLARNRAAGWICAIETAETAGLRELERARVPLVTIAAVVPDLACPAVLADNTGGMHAAVSHLIDHGHSRIAFVGWMQAADVRQRYDGYLAALAERGIPFDPHLVVAVDDHNELNGRAAAQRLLDAGLPCTAVAAATDTNAIGLMKRMQEAGVRLPADLAVVGFDDDPVGQYAALPLTTVRQRAEALGAAAAELLLARIAGDAVPPGPTYVLTALVLRKSCGCSVTGSILLPTIDAAAAERGWQDTLARQLVQLALHPMPIDESPPLTTIWPELPALIAGLAATASDSRPPDPAELEQAWRQAVALTPDSEIHLAMIKLLERVGRQLLHRADDPAAHARLEAYIDRARFDLTQAQHARAHAWIAYLEGLVRTNYDISIRLLAQPAAPSSKLIWLQRTPALWGSLLLWDSGDAPALVVEDTFCRAGANAPLLGQRFSPDVFPPAESMLAASVETAPDIILLLPIRTDSRDWGILALGGPLLRETRLSTDADESTHMWKTLIGAALDREALQGTLHAAYARERALATTVRALGSPVIPLLPEVLLVPLIGAIDAARAQQILEAILQGVSAYQATVVLLDITGVPLVDTQVAYALLQAARAASLLGAQVVLVGVRPEIAQSIVGLGLDLGQIATHPTLASAIRALLRERSASR